MRRLGRILAASAIFVALVAALAVAGAPAGALAAANDDPGCVTGNPAPGSECHGGPDDNQGQAGGGVGCAGGSNADRDEPCGREDGDGTLNSGGNVPGCTSQGEAIEHNPHCTPGEGTETPPVDGGETPPVDGGETPPVGGVDEPPAGGATGGVSAVPAAGIGPAAGGVPALLLALLAATGAFALAGGRSLRPRDLA